MKIKFLYFILILLSFNSCNQRSISEKIETRMYSYTKDYDKSKVIEIHLENSSLNFKELTLLIGRNQYHDSFTALTFKNKNIVKSIIPFEDESGHIPERNILRLTEDSIFWPFNRSIIDFPEALKLHYENNGKNYRFSRSVNKSVIQLSIDTSSVSEKIIDKLSLITTEFDKLNSRHKDTLELKLYFSFFRQLPPPPSPPKTPLIIKVEN